MIYNFSFLKKSAHCFMLLLMLCLFPFKGTTAPYTADLIGAGSNMVNIVQAQPQGDSSKALTLQKAVQSNMSFLPFVNMMDPRSIPGGAVVSGSEAANIDFKRFAMAKVHMLFSASWLSSSQVELRCFEVSEGKFMFGKRYDIEGGDEALLDVADKFCAEFLDAVIGRGDFFRSNLVFVKRDADRKRDVWSVRPNGRYLHRLTNMAGEALSPSVSPDGRKVIFTHIDKRSHGLGVYDTGSKTVQRVKFAGNTVIGPDYMPDGRVLVSLTDGRNPSIFLLGSGLQKERKVDESSAIDVSPSVDAKGRQMVFTSNRLGNPHIFLKDLSSGSVRRLSQSGNYNTDPSISPDGTLVAYARLVDGGHRIFVHDLTTGAETQVTFGPGSDEQPSFAADSYFISFTSSRSGSRQVYLTTRNGGEARKVPTGPGDASFSSWGPARN